MCSRCREKESLELLKMSNSFKKAASELEAVMTKRRCLEDKRKNNL